MITIIITIIITLVDIKIMTKHYVLCKMVVQVWYNDGIIINGRILHYKNI